MEQYLTNVGYALDLLINAIFGGKRGRTVTQRAAAAMKAGKAWGCILCRLLDFVDKEHCRRYGDP